MTYTKKTYAALTIATFAILIAGVAYSNVHAQENDLTPRERFLQMQKDAQIKKDEFETTQKERRDTFKETRDTKRADIDALRDEARAEMETRREEFQGASEEKRAEMKQKAEERKAEMKERVEQRKAALKARTQERIANLAANVSNRMEAAIARIEQIIARFQTRIDTLAERGVATEEAQAALNEASEHLDLATANIGNIDTLVEEVITSESPREAWATVRETYKEIKTHIRAAHESLRNALALLKKAVRDAKADRGVSSAVSQSKSNTEGTNEIDATEEPSDTDTDQTTE